MSTTETKRSYAEALADAEHFRSMFTTAMYSRWEFGGSLRRVMPDVSDVEHIIIPVFGDVPGAGLFAEKANLLFHRLEALVRNGHLVKHIYGATGNRWGERYRGVDFRGFNHELFIADADNWGNTLCIRTGPAEFSQRMVTGLIRNGKRNKDGRPWQCRPCQFSGERRCEKSCALCQGTGLEPIEPVACADERAYFILCGIPWTEPEKRA